MAKLELGDLNPSGLYLAPMAGGPSSFELIVAASRAGAVPFVAGGYLSAASLSEQLAHVDSTLTQPFGVNLFVPGVPSRERDGLPRYIGELEADAQALGATCGEAVWDDDDWSEKIDLVTSSPPPIVSFTFGCPEPDLVRDLQRAGSQVWVTVTSVDEARIGAGAGVDALCVQGPEAGAHRGRFDDRDDAGYDLPLLELLGAVARTVDLPLVAAGGIVSSKDAEAARAHGATAVQCGTAFLRCAESGAHPLHKAALDDPRFIATRVTRAFSGRRARGLVNGFVRAHPDAPSAYPEINNATRPLRAAATAASDVERLSLWAGTRFREAEVGSVAAIVQRLRS